MVPEEVVSDDSLCNRSDLLLERAKRYGYCMPGLPTFEELCNTADDQLFNKTVSNSRAVVSVLCAFLSSLVFCLRSISFWQ